MFTRIHKILIGLLIVQVALIVVMRRNSDDATAAKERPLLPGFDAAKVTRLQVFMPNVDQPIDLVKRDATWVLASHFDYPADDTNVSDLLTPIARMAAAAPIATQAGRHQQLRVDDAEFERKLVVTMGGKDHTILIGNAAGMRRTAVRLGGDNRVFGVAGVTAYSVGNEPRQWVDPSYVKIPSDQVAKITIQSGSNSFTFERRAAAPAAPAAVTPDGWEVAINGAPITLGTGESINTAAIDPIVTAVTTVELAAPGDPNRDASRPTAIVTIERKSDNNATPAPTVLELVADGESYWVHQRGLTRAVLVGKAQLSAVVELTRDTLIARPAPPTPVPTPR